MRTIRTLFSFALLVVFPLFADTEDVKPNTQCYALTVLRGNEPQRVPLVVVGTKQHHVFDGTRLTLVHMQNGTPVIAGMSGSPVTCGGKFVGALGWMIGNFPLQKGLAGITHIKDMRNQRATLGARSYPSSSLSPSSIQQIGIPILASDPSLLDSFKEIDGPAASFFRSVTPAMATPIINTAAMRMHSPGPIRPGDSVTFFLSRGAVTMGGTCTVTEVTDKTFSACGHSFLGEGDIALPAYRSSIVTSFKSSRYSFKVMGDVLYPIGTVTYDNIFAVQGVREILPDIMIPVSLSVNIDKEPYAYEFEVIRHRFFSSALVQSGTQTLLTNLWTGNRIGTGRIIAKIFLKGRPDPLVIYAAGHVTKRPIKFGFEEGFTNPWQVLSGFQELFSSLQLSEWNFLVERIALDIDVQSGNQILMLDSMTVVDESGATVNELRAGQRFFVLLGIRNEQGTQKLVRKFSFEIPKTLNLVKPDNQSVLSLPVTLVIASGSNYREMDPKKIPKARPQTADEFIRTLFINQRDPAELFATLILPPEYRVNTKNTPSLKDGWSTVSNLDFLRGQDASESRVITLSLGTPIPGTILSVNETRGFKLILNK